MTSWAAASRPLRSCIGLWPAAISLLASFRDVIGQDGYGGRTVTGDIVHLDGGLLDQLGANFVAQRFVVDISQFDTFGNRYAVVGDGRAP